MPNILQYYRDKFLSIQKISTDWLRNLELASLMTVMEDEFNIPALQDKEFEKANPVLMALYEDVSNARIL